VAILWRKPCLLILFRREGWKVLFIAIFYAFLRFFTIFRAANIVQVERLCKFLEN
jgi:hypothetical protein